MLNLAPKMALAACIPDLAAASREAGGLVQGNAIVAQAAFVKALFDAAA
jgi:hypothetical protein